MLKKGWDFRKIEQLRREKAAREGRDIQWAEVIAQTGICGPTLLRLRTQMVQRIDADSLHALCEYFGVSEETFRAHTGDRV